MAADLMMSSGALSVRALATHPVFSGPAYDRIQKCALSELLVTDTLPIKNNCNGKIKVLSCASFFAETIEKVINYQSISDSFLF